MKTLLTIINLFFLTTLFGQTKTHNNIKYSNGDTSIWYKYQLIVINDLSLTRLDTSSSLFYFRIWKTNQVLDVWKNKEGSYSGLLTTWVTEHTPNNEKQTDRTLIDKKSLQLDSVKLIIELIESSQILKLPTDDSIKGWRHGFDGLTYITEYSTQTSYSFKTYWTPTAQDTSLNEAKFVQSFVDTIFNLSNAKTIWQNFQKSIPYECYNVGGSIGCKVVTKKEKRRFTKERKNYRQQKYLQKQGGTM